MNDINLIRLTVLAGGFSSETIGKLPKEWRAQERLILVFISSTFTDTHEERNLLIQSIVPEVRKRFPRATIKVVDMRWGVRDENTLDHKTWLVCLQELQRCSNLSTGIFFMSLQSNKWVFFDICLSKFTVLSHNVSWKKMFKKCIFPPIFAFYNGGMVTLPYPRLSTRLPLNRIWERILPPLR